MLRASPKPARRLERGLSADGASSWRELVLGPGVGVVDPVRQVADLARRRRPGRTGACCRRRPRPAGGGRGPVTIARATTRPTPSLIVDGLTAAGPRPRLDRAVAAPRIEPLARPPDQGGDERRCGCSPRPLSSGSSFPRAWVESSFWSAPVEKNRRSSGSNRIAVTAPSWSLPEAAQEELVLPLGVEDGDRPLRRPGREPSAGRVGGQAGAGLGQVEGLERLAVLAREDQDLGTDQRGEPAVGQRGQRRGGGFELRALGLRRPASRPRRAGRRRRRSRGASPSATSARPPFGQAARRPGSACRRRAGRARRPGLRGGSVTKASVPPIPAMALISPR